MQDQGNGWVSLRYLDRNVPGARPGYEPREHYSVPVISQLLLGLWGCKHVERSKCPNLQKIGLTFCWDQIERRSLCMNLLTNWREVTHSPRPSACFINSDQGVSMLGPEC